MYVFQITMLYILFHFLYILIIYNFVIYTSTKLKKVNPKEKYLKIMAGYDGKHSYLS